MKFSEYLKTCVLKEATDPALSNVHTLQDKIKYLIQNKPEYKNLPLNDVVDIIEKNGGINDSTFAELDALLGHVNSDEYKKKDADQKMSFVKYIGSENPDMLKKMASGK